jgi:hypothetical protein
MKGHLTIGLFILASAICMSVRGQDEVRPKPGIAQKAAPDRKRLEAGIYRSFLGVVAETSSDMTPAPPITPEVARAWMLTRLTLMIDDIDRRTSLTEAQKTKLHAAGELDIGRFFERVEQMKEELLAHPGDPARARERRPANLRILSDYQSGLLAEGSFFSKVLNSILDEDQAARIRESWELRNRTRWRARALLTTMIWGNAIGLSDDQRRKLSDLIVAEIPPPNRPGPTDFQFIMYRLGQLHPAKLRPIFDDGQWRLFNRHLNQARTNERFKSDMADFGYDLGEANRVESIQEPAK